MTRTGTTACKLLYKQYSPSISKLLIMISAPAAEHSLTGVITGVLTESKRSLITKLPSTFFNHEEILGCNVGGGLNDNFRVTPSKWVSWLSSTVYY